MDYFRKPRSLLAVLFHIECAVNLRGSKTCTEEKQYWLLSSERLILLQSSLCNIV